MEELYNRAYELSDKMADESLSEEEREKYRQEYKQLREKAKREIARVAGVAPEDVPDELPDLVMQGHPEGRQREDGSHELWAVPYHEDDIKSLYEISTHLHNEYGGDKLANLEEAGRAR